MGTDSLYYIMDYSGNYYRTNQADQLVSVVSQQDAMVFTFAQANSRICVGKKAAFYCMIPIEDSEDETDAAECEEVSPDEEMGVNDMEKQENTGVEEYFSPVKELTYDELTEQAEKDVSSYDLSEIDWAEYLTHFTYLVEGLKDYREDLASKAYYLFAEQMERTDELFSLTEQEKLTLEYLSKTILSGVRPDELEILRLLLEKNRITYSEIIDDCKQRYSYEITNEKIDAACEVLKGTFVTNSSEREKFCRINILKLDGKDYLERILSYAEKLMHKDFYNQIQDIVEVGLARYKDKYSKPYRQKCPFVLYEKYSRRDVSLLMNAGKDLSSTMYGMSQLGDDVFIFVTYHKEENTDEEKQYVDGKPDYADEFVDNVIFRWDSQIDKKLDGAYMNKVLNTPRKHLFVQKTDAENNFFYMGEFDVLDAYEEEKKNNRGLMKPICKLKFRMHTAVREDLLRYLQSGNEMEKEAI